MTYPNVKGQTARSPEDLARLRQLWDSGMPSKAIAETMGPSWTKNTVIGLAHRQGFPSRANPIPNAKRKPRKVVAPKSAGRNTLAPLRSERIRLVHPAPRREPPRPAPAFVGGSDIGCQFITDGTRGRQRFCDAPRMGGKPYCECHTAICYELRAAKAAAA